MKYRWQIGLAAVAISLSVALLLSQESILFTVGSAQAQEAAAKAASMKSSPPDTTPYVRPLVPEDYAPGGRPAIPSNIYVPRRDQRLRDQRLRKQTPGRSNNGGA